ncbi:hypothetical protein ACFU76_17295 [Streptomyces sp. NPDC057539]|uniref:hypothetical protein n=1 Tax=Streptomyces sp. NPDC057539 TaxID=3346159 RepID=UPI0036C311C5
MAALPAHTPLADLASSDFVVTYEGHGVAGGQDRRYRIGLSADGTPLTLAVHAPSTAPRRMPAVVVSGSATLQDVVEGSALLHLLELSPDAAVVMDHASGTVTGVLERATVDAYLRQDRFPGGPVRAGGGALTGDDGCLCGTHRTPHAHVVCAFGGCGRVNALHFYDPEDPPECPGPGGAGPGEARSGGAVPAHPLTLSLRG